MLEVSSIWGELNDILEDSVLLLACESLHEGFEDFLLIFSIEFYLF